VNPWVNVPLCVSLLVTITFTGPVACAGVVAVIVVLFTTVTPVDAVPPMLTVAPARNPVPVMDTAVPPLIVPEFGEMEVTVGAGVELELRRRELATEGTPLLFKINSM
jgi:hypothetical protein